MLAIVEWSLGNVLEMGSTELSTKLFWTNAEYLGIVALPVMWLFFGLHYTGQERWLTRRNLALVAIVPLITLLLVWSNGLHGLMWHHISLDTSGPFSSVVKTYGTWFWVHTAYSYLLLLLGTVVLVHALIRRPRLYHGQAMTLLISALVPWLGNASYISGLTVMPHLDVTPYAFALSGLAIAWGLFRFRLLEIIPVAHETIVEGMRDSVIVLDERNRIVDLNLAAQRIIGHPAAEAIGQPAARMLSGQTDLVGRYRDVPEAHEEIILGQGKTQCAYDLRISPLRDHRGRIAARLVILRDITDRKRAERLLQGLNQAALAMERALTPAEVFTTVAEEFKKLGFACKVFLMDDSQSRLFIKYWSYDAGTLKALEKLTGVHAERFSVSTGAADAYRKVIRDRKTVLIENVEAVTRQLLPDPLKRLARQIVSLLKMPPSIAAPLIVENKVTGLLSVESHDLTEEDMPAITAFAHQMAAAWHKARLLQELQNSLAELEETQAQLLQAQKMEAVGRLAGGVAHDFNNILTTVIGYSQLLLTGLAPDDPRCMDVEEILKSAERAASLTRQLLAFSRQQILRPQVLDLNRLVAETEKMLRRLIGEDIELITILHPDLPRIRADPGQINQVMMNLAVNARDAMPRGGTLTIETENATLDHKGRILTPWTRPGRFVRLSVADTGVGMDEEIMQHLFEPFFTTKGPGEGTGLGLAVVHGIVAQHEGWINVHSEPGQGSNFSIYLPAFSVQPTTQMADPVPLGEPYPHDEGILLVEDDDALRRVAGRMLGERGHVVFEATCAEDAREVFEKEEAKIQLVFSDVVLPDGNGVELVDELLTRKRDLRILLSSGYTDDRSRWSSVQEKGFQFVQKPYTWPELLRAIRETMELSH